MARVANLVAFQIGWFACALSPVYGHTWSGPIVVALLVAAQLCWLPRPARQALVVLVAIVAGAVVDSAHARLGVVAFEQPLYGGWLAPPWMIALWANFAITLRDCLSWLDGRWLLAALLGGLGGPASYLAGARLGAIQFPAVTAAGLLVLALDWALITPALVWLASRVAGPLPATAPAIDACQGR